MRVSIRGHHGSPCPLDWSGPAGDTVRFRHLNLSKHYEPDDWLAPDRIFLMTGIFPFRWSSRSLAWDKLATACLCSLVSSRLSPSFARWRPRLLPSHSSFAG